MVLAEPIKHQDTAKFYRMVSYDFQTKAWQNYSNNNIINEYVRRQPVGLAVGLTIVCLCYFYVRNKQISKIGQCIAETEMA